MHHMLLLQSTTGIKGILDMFRFAQIFILFFALVNTKKSTSKTVKGFKFSDNLSTKYITQENGFAKIIIRVNS